MRADTLYMRRLIVVYVLSISPVDACCLPATITILGANTRTIMCVSYGSCVDNSSGAFLALGNAPVIVHKSTDAVRKITRLPLMNEAWWDGRAIHTGRPSDFCHIYLFPVRNGTTTRKCIEMREVLLMF